MEKIPVIQPVKEAKEFSSIDEFNVFYNDHKDEFEEQTTCMLNKKYKVPGFRITKIKGEVKLKNIPESRKTALDKVNAANDRIFTLENKLNNIITAFNNVIDKCNAVTSEVKLLRNKIAELESKPSVIVKEAPKPEPIHEAPPKPAIEPEKKVKLNDSAPYPQKREIAPKRPGQMMDSALAWLNGG